MTERPDDIDRDLRDQLRQLRVDPPSGAFEASLRRRLLEAGPPPPVGLVARLREALAPALRAALWPAVGVAAGLLAFVLLQVARGPAGGPPVALPASRVAVVHLDLSADVAVEAADIRVTLPPGLVFWSHGEALAERDLAWSQPLSAGQNEIPIAVRGLRPGRYRIAVEARIGKTRVEHEVPIEVIEG